MMKIKILRKLFTCGDLGTIIDCNHSGIICNFCNNRTNIFDEKLEVTPEELYDLINKFDSIIIIK